MALRPMLEVEPGPKQVEEKSQEDRLHFAVLKTGPDPRANLMSLYPRGHSGRDTCSLGVVWPSPSEMAHQQGKNPKAHLPWTESP